MCLLPMQHVRLGFGARRVGCPLAAVVVVAASFASDANDAVHRLRAEMHSGVFLKGHGDVREGDFVPSGDVDL